MTECRLAQSCLRLLNDFDVRGVTAYFRQRSRSIRSCCLKSLDITFSSSCTKKVEQMPFFKHEILEYTFVVDELLIADKP